MRAVTTPPIIVPLEVEDVDRPAEELEAEGVVDLANVLLAAGVVDGVLSGTSGGAEDADNKDEAGPALQPRPQMTAYRVHSLARSSDPAQYPR